LENQRQLESVKLEQLNTRMRIDKECSLAQNRLIPPSSRYASETLTNLQETSLHEQHVMEELQLGLGEGTKTITITRSIEVQMTRQQSRPIEIQRADRTADVGRLTSPLAR
jgi:hypothetical protein